MVAAITGSIQRQAWHTLSLAPDSPALGAPAVVSWAPSQESSVYAGVLLLSPSGEEIRVDDGTGEDDGIEEAPATMAYGSNARHDDADKPLEFAGMSSRERDRIRGVLSTEAADATFP